MVTQRRRAECLLTSIRQKRNRVVLEGIQQSTTIFEAWPDKDWFDAGTAVRVSLVCFGSPGFHTIKLAGKPAALIHADLTASSDASTVLDLTQAKLLPTNKDRSFLAYVLLERLKWTPLPRLLG
ncbi:hypothetical protein [Nitrosomonas communis]|uniref:Uncharacterized protein n=1 Tax=Nitrosomonas communis TaxID=44574 RepID=A0A1I4T6W1_9PROT|nr:hypothetical protein [Nitrosomonas communis]SFM72300.1 hypothetical protein SAMN05421863_104727 [Nitrosomonas communis]